MTETFQCASCSGPLDFEGTPMQKCKFCGSTMIVPSELFHHQAFDASVLNERQQKIAEIRNLIAQGQKLMAIKVFRETFGVGLKEAKDAVEAMERGTGVDLSAIGAKMPEIQIKPEDIKKLAKVGVSVGKTVITGVLLLLVLTVGIIFAVFYFGYRTMNRAIDKALIPPTSGSKRSGNTTPINETLRIGGQGDGGGKFKDNRSVAVGVDSIYSIEYGGGQLQVFGADGQFQTQWEANRGLPVKDIAADRNGHLAVLDSSGLLIFEGSTGKLIRKKGDLRAESAAFAPDGRLVAAGRDGLTIFDADLNPAREFRDAGEKASAKFGFTRVAVSGEGSIFAVDRQNGDVCKFTLDGKFLNRFSTGSTSVTAIAVAPNGRIFVAQPSKVGVFDTNGVKIGTFAATQAYGIAFDTAGSLFIASRPFVVKYAVTL